MKTFKWIAIILILIFGGFSIVVLSIGTLRSQIVEIAGLAVARTPIQWNRLKDAAVGDDQKNGIAATALYLWDGTFNVARGTLANGMAVDVTRVAGMPVLGAGSVPVYTTVSATFTTNQIVVNNALGGTLIRAINLTRRSIIIKNQGVVDMYVGVTGVAITTGLLVKAGEAITLDRTTAAIYGITAAGATDVGYLEE